MPFIKQIFRGFLLSSFFASASHACPMINGLVDYNCDRKHQISAIGDSIVFGVGDTVNGNQGGYVLRLKREFKSSEVFNFGYPGITTNRLLAYYKKLFLKNPRGEEVERLGNSDIIIIDVGRNDYYNRNSSATTAATIKRLTTFLSTELEKKFGTSPLFVVSVLPLTRREMDLGFIKQVNMILLKIRNQSFPVFLRFDKLSPKLLSTDGLHPTSTGYNILADIASTYIRGEAQSRSKNLRKDKDADRIYDVFEKKKFGTAPGSQDTDADGLIDGEEVFSYETDPLNADTDGDGAADGLEVQQNTDPGIAS